VISRVKDYSLYSNDENIIFSSQREVQKTGSSQRFGTMLGIMKIKGKTALVTGGGRRLGKEIALSLADQGANIILHYHQSQRDAEETSRKIRKAGVSCYLSSHNLEDAELTGIWFEGLLKTQGCPDILINSASNYTEDSYSGMSSADLQKSMSLHVYSPMEIIRHMYDSGKEVSVVNILDTRVVDRDPAHASYHLGKRGMLTITRDLAVDFAPHLRINAVAPGIILPPEGKGEEWIERLKSSNPLKRRGNAEDICDAVQFLVGAEFTTGQIIFVDGGRHLKGNAYGL